MAVDDDYVNISLLGARTTGSEADIAHIRSTGGIDSKITLLNLITSMLSFGVGATLSAITGVTLALTGALSAASGTFTGNISAVVATFTGALSATTGTFSGALAATSLDTGQGANELYDMNQDVKTTDAVTFATVDTGQGANELYDMNQNVKTTSAVTFATVNTGQGANELYDMNQNVLTSSSPTFANVKSTGAGYRHSTGASDHNDMFDAISPVIPTTGQMCTLHGGANLYSDSDKMWIFSRAYRASSTTITLYAFQYDSTGDQMVAVSMTVTNGSSSEAFFDVSFSTGVQIG